MTTEIGRRCGIALFIALTLASAFGLAAGPSFDPLTLIVSQCSLWTCGLAECLAALLGALATSEALRRGHAGRSMRRWPGEMLRSIYGVAWIAASGWWISASMDGRPDSRALLWLTVQPLLMLAADWASGAGRGRINSQAVSKKMPHGSHGLRMMGKGDVPRPANVQLSSASPGGIGSRKDDVVTVPIDAEEQLAA